jgi:hypothetical protein
MQTLARLLEHQGKLLRDIGIAARKQDAAAVLALQRKLETLASLIRRQEEIDRTLAVFERSLAAGPDMPVTTTEGPASDDYRKVSAKERGRRHRDDFVRTLSSRGVVLHRLKGAIFRSPRGTRVGVAYGRESKSDRWFLGLPEDGFDQAVLLCEDRSGRVIHFSLTKEFMDEHGDALSRKDGQVKLNVFRRDGEFSLQLPKRGSVTIEPYRDNFSGLI